jgi:hypothetical protein
LATFIFKPPDPDKPEKTKEKNHYVMFSRLRRKKTTTKARNFENTKKKTIKTITSCFQAERRKA